MVYGGGAITERFRSDSRPMRSDGVFAVVGLDGNIHHGDGGTPSLRKQRKEQSKWQQRRRQSRCRSTNGSRPRSRARRCTTAARPLRRLRSTDQDKSVDRGGGGGSTELPKSVDRPRKFGRASRPSRSTGKPRSVDRVRTISGGTLLPSARRGRGPRMKVKRKR